MASKEDKSRFRIITEPAYFENTSLIIEAEYYDKSYELQNEHVVKLELKNENADLFQYEFLNTGNKYSVDLGKLVEGEYSWNAQVNDGLEIFSKSGSFRIMPLQLEKNTLRADHQLLVNLSENHGGRMLYPNELEAFTDEILSNTQFKPILHYAERFKDLISIKIIFFVLLFLFTAEWIIRKYFGFS